MYPPLSPCSLLIRQPFLSSAVALIWQNALAYNPVYHPYTALANDFKACCDRLNVAARGDIALKWMLTSCMRHQLKDNILTLPPARALDLIRLLETICPDALERSDGVALGIACEDDDDDDAAHRITSIAVDALNMKAFLAVDCRVRRWMVQPEDEEDHDATSGGNLTSSGGMSSGGMSSSTHEEPELKRRRCDKPENFDGGGGGDALTYKDELLAFGGS